MQKNYYHRCGGGDDGVVGVDSGVFSDPDVVGVLVL